MITTEQIKQKIQSSIKGADVVVEDLRGDQKHYGVDVIASEFEGKTIIQQHQMIYDALGLEMKEKIHALRIKTSSK
jgi:stress-induced morphogen